MTDAVARLTSSLADRYRIERELGQGGMATVYLAEDVKHRRKVAIKVLNPELAHVLGPERFQREIEIAARLHHPHILPLLDSGEAGGFLYFVMPLSEGESLRARLDREKQLPLDDALRIAREVADALSYAHSQGVIHRDIKPENILLESGHAVVADFGIAKAISAVGERGLTGTGMVVGTPAYMSPEQATGERILDGRSDLYSLGCVLYEMLAGQAPFTGPSAESVIRQHMAADPPIITNIRPGVPAPVVAAIQRALAKTPADRFNPVALFAEALSVPPPLLRPIAAVRTGRRLAIGIGAAAVVGVIAWAGWRAIGSRDPDLHFERTRQVTREPALEFQAAISPDGQEVAYASGYPGSIHIEVRDVSGGRPLSLTGDWQGSQVLPRWAPAGQSVRFINRRTTADHAAGVWVMPRMGGQAVTAGPAATEAVGRQWALEMRGDSAFARNADGAATLLLVGPPAPHSAAWSADGSRMAFVQGNPYWLNTESLGNTAPSSIWVVSAGDAPVRVTEGASLNVSPAWLPDGRLLFVSNRDGPRDVYVVRLDRSGHPGGAPIRLTTGLDAYSVSVSADGATAAYDHFTFRRNIYWLPVPGAGGVSIREARPLTALNQTVESMSVSRDGQWLAFDSNLDGGQDVYVMPAAGGEARRVTRNPGTDMGPDFSPDGREIAFYSTRNGTRDIYAINADGTGEQRLVGDSSQSYSPTFSPDGLRIAYFNLTGGIFVLRRDRIGGAWTAPERIVADGIDPRWSPDGTRLMFTRASGGERMIGILAAGGAVRSLIEGRAGGLRELNVPRWSEDGRTVYFVARAPDGLQGLYEIAAAGGGPRLLVRFDDPAMNVFVGRGIAVGNGRFYLAVTEMQSDIYVMDLVRR